MYPDVFPRDYHTSWYPYLLLESYYTLFDVAMPTGCASRRRKARVPKKRWKPAPPEPQSLINYRFYLSNIDIFSTYIPICKVMIGYYLNSSKLMSTCWITSITNSIICMLLSFGIANLQLLASFLRLNQNK